jgi:hypothetical protein
MSDKRKELCKKIKKMLGDLQIYVNRIDIHKFGIKIKNQQICIYIFVDFESTNLYVNLKQLFIEYSDYPIKLKEYIYPLEDKYSHIFNKIVEDYNNIPFAIKFIGLKTVYLKQIINNYYVELPTNTKKTIIHLIINE